MIAQLTERYIKLRPTKAIVRLISYGLFEGRPVTTKGRWINPIVFGLYSLFMRLPQLKHVKNPVFILGTGRSGTTLLGLLLSMHRDVGYLNEPKALWNSIYPHEDVIGSYSSNTAHYLLGDCEATEQIRERAHKCFGGYLRTVCQSRVVDKYPELIFRVDFVKALFPDARFVLIVRDGNNTCHSIEKWSQRKGSEKSGLVHDWWGVGNRKWNLLVEQVLPNHTELNNHAELISKYTNHTHMALVEWILSMSHGDQILNKHPNDVHLVRYEDLTTSPEKELNKICRFLELDPDPVMVEHANATVRSTVRHGSIAIPEELRGSYNKAMKRFGYDS